MSNERKEATELLKCPFCGRPAITYHAFPEFDEGWHVDCEHDDACILRVAHGMFACEATKEKAAEAWNRRAASPSPPPGVGEVVKALLDIHMKLLVAEADGEFSIPMHDCQGWTKPILDAATIIDKIGRAPPVVGVEVMKLEWGPYPIPEFAGTDVAVAKTIMNHQYQVQRDPWAPTYVAYLHPILPITDSTLWWESKGHSTIEEAKAAAQADFERRIRSMLV